MAHGMQIPQQWEKQLGIIFVPRYISAEILRYHSG